VCTGLVVVLCVPDSGIVCTGLVVVLCVPGSGIVCTGLVVVLCVPGSGIGMWDAVLGILYEQQAEFCMTMCR
jgi:hypothetical protein